MGESSVPRRREGFALLDVHFLGHDDMRALVCRHMHGIRRLFITQNKLPWFVLAVESNLGLEASHVAHIVRDMERVVVLRETGPEGKHGVCTTHQRKLEFVSLLEQSLLEHAVSIADRIASDDAEKCIADLRKQLMNYRKVNSETGRGSAFAQAKLTYSGKVGEDGRMAPHAFQDDLCITLQLAVFWSSYVLQRKCKFLNYKRLFD